MSVPLYALIGFVFWTLALLVAIAVARMSKVLAGSARAGDFPSGVPHGSDAYWRLNRAHANCVENLPLFAAVVLGASATGYESGTFDDLARVYVVARVIQSLVHISSGSERAVSMRFTAFLVQFVCLAWMAVALVL
jgi:uncharacterized MAPEG superfamily protein